MKMKNSFWLIALCLLASCGVKKIKNSESESQNSKSEMIQNSELKIQNSTSEIQNSKQENDSYNFSIQPIMGTDAVFSFNYNGKLFEGKTNAPITFSNEKKKSEKIIKKNEQTETIYKTQTTYKTHTTYKSVTSNKDVTRSITFGSWILIIVLIVAFWELLKYVVTKRHKLVFGK